MNFQKKHHNLTFDTLYMQHRRFRMFLSLCILMYTHYIKKPKYTYTLIYLPPPPQSFRGGGGQKSGDLFSFSFFNFFRHLVFVGRQENSDDNYHDN